MSDLTAYKEQVEETLNWLGNGRTTKEFDTEYGGLVFRPGKVIAYHKTTPILGSMNQGLGPFTWAGRLDLLQHMVLNGLVDFSNEVYSKSTEV